MGEVEELFRRVLNELSSKRIVRAKQEQPPSLGPEEVLVGHTVLLNPPDSLPKPSAFRATVRVETNPMSSIEQPLPHEYRGFKPIIAPGPLVLIAFNKDEFGKNFSDEWYDKRWKQHTVRWNGKGRQWRYLEFEDRPSQAKASADIELDSNTEESSSEEEEEAWRQMVGNRYLEGMRVGTVLRRPRYTTSRP